MRIIRLRLRHLIMPACVRLSSVAAIMVWLTFSHTHVQAKTQVTKKTQEAQETKVTANPDITQAPYHGSAQGAVKIVKFSDFYCGTCKTMAKVIQELINTEKYQAKVGFYYMHYPVKTQHSHQLAVESYCAAQQSKFWEFHDTVFSYHGQAGKLNPETGINIARQLKLDEKAFTSCAQSAPAKAHVAHSKAQGDQLKVAGTPSIYINGTLLPANTKAALITALDQALAASTPHNKNQAS